MIQNDYDFDVAALRVQVDDSRLAVEKNLTKKSGANLQTNMAAFSLQNSCLKTGLYVAFILLFFGYLYHRLVLGIMNNNFSGITGISSL